MDKNLSAHSEVFSTIRSFLKLKSILLMFIFGFIFAANPRQNQNQSGFQRRSSSAQSDFFHDDPSVFDPSENNMPFNQSGRPFESIWERAANLMADSGRLEEETRRLASRLDPGAGHSDGTNHSGHRQFNAQTGAIPRQPNRYDQYPTNLCDPLNISIPNQHDPYDQMAAGPSGAQMRDQSPDTLNLSPMSLEVSDFYRDKSSSNTPERLQFGSFSPQFDEPAFVFDNGRVEQILRRYPLRNHGDTEATFSEKKLPIIYEWDTFLKWAKDFNDSVKMSSDENYRIASQIKIAERAMQFIHNISTHFQKKNHAVIQYSLQSLRKFISSDQSPLKIENQFEAQIFFKRLFSQIFPSLFELFFNNDGFSSSDDDQEKSSSNNPSQQHLDDLRRQNQRRREPQTDF